MKNINAVLEALPPPRPPALVSKVFPFCTKASKRDMFLCAPNVCLNLVTILQLWHSF